MCWVGVSSLACLQRTAVVQETAKSAQETLPRKLVYDTPPAHNSVATGPPLSSKPLEKPRVAKTAVKRVVSSSSSTDSDDVAFEPLPKAKKSAAKRNAPAAVNGRPSRAAAAAATAKVKSAGSGSDEPQYDSSVQRSGKRALKGSVAFEPSKGEPPVKQTKMASAPANGKSDQSKLEEKPRAVKSEERVAMSTRNKRAAAVLETGLFTLL